VPDQIDAAVKLVESAAAEADLDLFGGHALPEQLRSRNDTMLPSRECRD
jgi:hypothetical protein